MCCRVRPFIDALRKPWTTRCCLAALLLGLCGISRVSAAQKPVEAPKVLHGPLGTTEVGLIDGAPYRIDIPQDWNHSLVVYYHGYAQNPVTYPIADKLNWQIQPFLDRHYAIVQSAYSQTGWALAQAFPETESVRKYFAKKFGEPKETYVAGSSMGGVLVSVTLELNPKPYLAGLDFCGSVGPTIENFEFRFAMRAAFDHYFPNLMPPLVPTPKDYEITTALNDRVLTALKNNPTAAASLRNLMGVHNDAEVAENTTYFTYVVGDLQRRANGNPFDNRNYIYTGTNPTSSLSDAELNDHVQRYAASPAAREYLIRHYTPSGHLGKPMLAVHTMYDPRVPPRTLALYEHLVEEAGASENFVQQYVRTDGHCNISRDNIGRAFDEVVQWAHTNQRPAPGLLK